MDYERIEKPSVPGGGFSLGKLSKAKLLEWEKRRNDEEELEARFSLRSDLGSSAVESCKDVEIVSLRIPVQQDDPADSESGLLGFEFQRAERAQLHRSVLMPPFSKPAPSKWDDAQKWIASPTSNRQGKGGLGQPKKPGLMGYGSRQQAASAKVILDVLEEADTKRIDLNQVRKETDGKRVSLVPELYPLEDLSINAIPMVGDSVPNPSINLSQHDSSPYAQTETAFVMPPTTVKSVSMRDMGTEMTPIASQDPSRTGTPVGATTPARTPTPSRPSTPTRAAPSMSPIESAIPCGDNELSEKELKIRTKREIMVLGTQLGKMNIAAWASKEEAEIASVS
ncbi:hypothetical protein HPP92_004723 [Vanilla planifolia]|nr:hypothetical protein HPP92_004723 [Vanilla planifolia]